MTDIYCRWGARWLGHFPGPARSLAGRFHSDLVSAQVESFPLIALRERCRDLWAPARSRAEVYEAFLRTGQRLGESVARRLERYPLDPARDAFFCYDTGALEPLRVLGLRGIPSALAQIDPARVEEELVAEERRRWPGWEDEAGVVPEEYWERLRAEWEAATTVIVNSPWSRTALLAQGVPASKLRVIPLAYEAEAQMAPRPRREGPLRVLWLGLVCLRKGFPYFLEAARQLTGRQIEMIAAGPIAVSARALQHLPPNVRMLGRVQRRDVHAIYARADVFVLPTLSDGFALTQLEAMAHGLPVISTPRCGEVVNPGQDGLVIPPGDAQALVAALCRLDDDRGLLDEMSQRALMRPAEFGLDRFAARLEQAFSEPEEAARAEPT